MKIDIYVALSKLPKKVSTSQIATCSKALELVIPAMHKCTGNHCGWMDTIIDQTELASLNTFAVTENCSQTPVNSTANRHFLNSIVAVISWNASREKVTVSYDIQLITVSIRAHSQEPVDDIHWYGFRRTERKNCKNLKYNKIPAFITKPQRV